LSQWPDGSQARDRALFLARRAAAYAAMGERDQARVAAEDALTAAAGLASGRVTGRLAALAGRLATWQDDPGMAATLRKLVAAAGAHTTVVMQGGPP